MSLRINDIKINNSLIIEEIARLRPEYKKKYSGQDEIIMEAQLLEWAKENIVERFLVLEYAKNDLRKISHKRVKSTLKQLKKTHTEEKDLYKLFGMKKKDEQKLKIKIESQLRIDRVIQEIGMGDDATSIKETDRNSRVDQFIDELKKTASIEFILDEDLKKLLKINKQKDKTTYKKQLNFILIKPSGADCNMSCTYCFYYEKMDVDSKKNPSRMKYNTLEEMTSQAITQSDEHISFGWQGGEPTLMGLPFFKKAVELQKKYGKSRSMDNTFQTNGILINQDWACFFRENDFLVGLSLDGPEHVHDHYRLNHGGKGTWKQVLDAAKILLTQGTKTNALVVVNDYSVQFPHEIYSFHKKLGLNYMQFIPCVETDPNNQGQAASFSVSANQYGIFLCKLFDYWLSDFYNETPTVSIRLFDSVFYTYVNLSAPQCTQSKECGKYLVVEYNGDVYACDFFVEPKWKLGNVMNSNLIEMLNSKKQTDFGQFKYNLSVKCYNCKWLEHCRGGCPKDRLNDPKDKGISHFCESYRMFFEYTDEKFRKLAHSWKQN